MITRTVAIPAKYVPSLDLALDKLLAQIEAGEIPVFAQDSTSDDLLVTVRIEEATHEV